MKQILLRRYMSSDMGWGVEEGQRVRHALERDIATFPSGVVEIDLDRIRLMDVSFSREAIIETVRRFRPGHQFIAANPVNTVVVENLEAALERRGDSLVLREKDGRTRIIGQQLGPSLRPVFDTVERLRTATSREVLVHHKGLSIQNCSNKLKELWEAGLILREELSAKSGGKECVYRVLE
jgi:hypothetical protein